jgi:PAS domain S-box-containing protein
MSEAPNNRRQDARDAARWTAVFEAAVHAVITIDSAGTIDGFNQAAERMFGHRRQAVLGRNVRMLMPEPDSERHDSYMQRFQATGEARVIGTGREVTAIRANGETFPIHLSVGRFQLDGAQGFVAVIHDLSAQQAAERRLRQRDQVVRPTPSGPVRAVSWIATGRNIR